MFLYHALFDLAGFAQLGFQGVELAVHVRNRLDMMQESWILLASKLRFIY
jgi:hypothetical protein